MRNRMKRLIAICLTLAMVAGSVITTNAASNQAGLGALADTYTAGSGTFTLTESSRIFVAAEAEPTGALLQTAQLINRQFSEEFPEATKALELVWGQSASAKAGDVILNLDKNSEIATEGYKLEVTDKAMVTASDVDGLLYGANMIQKYFDVAGSLSLSGFTAEDTPDTKERTVMLDTGRKYYTAEWIKNFIKQISWMGYNAIEIHFSEDGGYRADLWDSTYYKGEFQPENDFSWLCGSKVQSWVYDGAKDYTNDPDAGKYLSTKELVEICEVAKEYHIEIIPSFDSPAHMDYITWKFEQNYKNNRNYSFTYDGTTYAASSTNGCINYTGRTGDSSPTWPYYTTIDITDGTMAKAFVFALYEDMADFFKEYAGSTKFNIGADEVNLTSYASSAPRKWSYSQFPGYVNELNGMLNAKGYTTRMFNDFIGSTTYNKSSNEKAVYDFDDNIEILYWNSDFNPNTGKWTDATWHVKFFWENNTGTSDNWGDGGRTMYNCIQTNCYYVLREGTSGNNRDARNPDNRNWTFYHSNEEDIYNEWYPADISEKGDYTENAADVPADQLGGAYFLIWNDYAAMNTESEVWNGVYDKVDAPNNFYSLFNRMYSNIIKMWNSDINSSVAYSKFALTRDAFGYFPGFESCSAPASMLAASELTRAYTADHSELEALLAGEKITNEDGKYTVASYAAYASAYDKAVDLNKNPDATEKQIADMVTVLTEKRAALVDLTPLKEALAAEENHVSNDSGLYTEDSYAAYLEAYAAAQTVYKDDDATATEVSEAITNLANAVTGLEKEDTTQIDSESITVDLMTKVFKKGKKVGLKVTTASGVETLAITDESGQNVELTTLKGKGQTLTTGAVKVWLVKFETPAAKETYTYTLTAGEEQETFKFVIK